MKFLVPAKYRQSSGIYAIRNSLDGKVYVGSAQDYWARYQAHLSALKRGSHHAGRLQDFVNQHSTDVLRFELLQLVPLGEDLGLVEHGWICATDATSPAYGFNIEESPRARLAEAPKGRIEVDFSVGSFDKLEYLAELHGISVQELIMKFVADGVSALAAGLAGSEKKPLKTWNKFNEANMLKVEQCLATGMSVEEIAAATNMTAKSVKRYKVLLLGPFGRDNGNRQGRQRVGIELARAQGKQLGRPTGVDQAGLEKVRACLAAGMSINTTIEATGIGATSVKRYRKLLKKAN